MTYEIKVVRSVLEEDAPVVRIVTPRQVVDYAMKYLYDSADMWRESAWLLLIGKSGNVLGHFLLGIGGIGSVVIDKRVVAKVAIDLCASAVVLVHNHPGGDCMPSQSDIKQTAEVKSALGVFDIRLLDHVIIGEGEYYSFNEEIKGTL